MNTILKSASINAVVNSYEQTCLTLASAKKQILKNEDLYDFSTIDGGVVAHHAVTTAISTGSGIFIGEYFVGTSDSYESISNMPIVHY